MAKTKDLTGMRFGKLTVIGRAPDHIQPSGKKVSRWYCICDCQDGVETPEIKVITYGELSGNRITSCGCTLKNKRIQYRNNKYLNKTFGKLTVNSINEELTQEKQQVYLNCECECEKDLNQEKKKNIVVSGYYLTTSVMPSCGCYIEDKSIALRNKVIGEKYGKLTITSFLEDRMYDSGETKPYYLCTCDCGENDVEACFYDMKYGRKTSCGCDNIHKMLYEEKMIGKKFGKLTVVKRGDNANDGHSQWWCRCDCGNPELVLKLGQGLTNNIIVDCGCGESLRRSKANSIENIYDLSGEYGIGYDYVGNYFLFDKEDFDKIKNFYWTLDPNNYVISCATLQHKELRMHRLIMNCPDGMIVDHIHHMSNGDGTENDNRKSNLRIANASQNGMNSKIQNNNTSGYPGVHWHSRDQVWTARINVNKKQKWLGDFDNKEDAIKARKEAEEKYYQDYSYGNSMLLNMEEYNERFKKNEQTN